MRGDILLKLITNKNLLMATSNWMKWCRAKFWCHFASEWTSFNYLSVNIGDDWKKYGLNAAWNHQAANEKLSHGGEFIFSSWERSNCTWDVWWLCIHAGSVSFVNSQAWDRSARSVCSCVRSKCSVKEISYQPSDVEVNLWMVPHSEQAYFTKIWVIWVPNHIYDLLVLLFCLLSFARFIQVTS